METGSWIVAVHCYISLNSSVRQRKLKRSARHPGDQMKGIGKKKKRHLTAPAAVTTTATICLPYQNQALSQFLQVPVECSKVFAYLPGHAIHCL